MSCPAEGRASRPGIIAWILVGLTLSAIACDGASASDANGDLGDGDSGDGDLGDGDSGDGDSGDGDSGDGGSQGFEEDGCVEMIGNEITLAMELFRNDNEESCKSDGPDAALSWTAPARGRYVFSADGGWAAGQPPAVSHSALGLQEWRSAPKLSSFDGACGGEELACVDANVFLESGNLSRFALPLEAGQEITLMVDAKELSVGEREYWSEDALVSVVRVAAANCGELVLDGDLPIHEEEPVRGVGHPVGPVSCGSRGAPTEISWLFTAAEAGSYSATVVDEYGGDVSLGMFDAECMEEMDCNKGDPGGTAELRFDLEEGQSVALVASAPTTGSESYKFILDLQLEN